MKPVREKHVKVGKIAMKPMKRMHVELGRKARRSGTSRWGPQLVSSGKLKGAGGSKRG